MFRRVAASSFAKRAVFESSSVSTCRTTMSAAMRFSAAAASVAQPLATVPPTSAASATSDNNASQLWAALEADAHQRLKTLVVGKENVTDLRRQLATIAAVPKPSFPTLAAALAAAKTLQEAVQQYEYFMEPIRRLDRKRVHTQLDVDHLYDQIKLAVKLTPADIDKKKKLLESTKKEVASLVAEVKTASKAFSAESVLTLTNVLRVVGHERDDAHTLATMILDEATGVCSLPLSSTAAQLVTRNIIFGDGPAEDSGVLFALVEFPERGEVSVSRQTVGTIADEVLSTVSVRHVTPVTPAGVKLQQEDTYPMLQRSSE